MTGSPTAPPPPSARPTVLVVLVVRDAAAWLRETVAALAAQTYPRMAVLAVDNAFDRRLTELLEQALGGRRVIALPRTAWVSPARSGPPWSCRSPPRPTSCCCCMTTPRMDPDAVLRLVEAAVGIGCRPRRRRGRQGGRLGCSRVACATSGESADLFGHAYTPLQPDEIDQGQFDRVLEVLSVSSSSAMLVSREAWKRAGLLRRTARRRVRRTRLLLARPPAGFRVVMTPLARARHRVRDLPEGERATAERDRSPRYREDRAAIASMCKNYGAAVPAVDRAARAGPRRGAAAVPGARPTVRGGLGPARGLGMERRPPPGHAPKRRRRVQKMRRIKDRQLRRFMESAGLRLASLVPDGRAHPRGATRDRGRRAGRARRRVGCGIEPPRSSARTR